MNILILESQDFPADALKTLSTLRKVHLGKTSNNKEIDMVMCRLAHKLDDFFLNSYPNLKYIVTPTTGLTHIDMDVMKRKKIKVISLKGPQHTFFLSTITSTAELTFGLILSLLRNIPTSSQDVINGNWNRDQFKGKQLSELTIGIIGYGRLGKIIATIAKGFSMKILCYDLIPSNDTLAKYVPLEELMAESDIISVHMDLRDENRKFFNKHIFSLAKKSPLFFNTSRGELINEEDLVTALKLGQISGAGLDVLIDENEKDFLKKNPIWQYATSHNNVLITPHIGGATRTAMKKTEEYLSEYFVAYMREQK